MVACFCFDTFNRNFLVEGADRLAFWSGDCAREYRGLNVTERDYAVHDWKEVHQGGGTHRDAARHGLVHRRDERDPVRRVQQGWLQS